MSEEAKARIQKITQEAWDAIRDYEPETIIGCKPGDRVVSVRRSTHVMDFIPVGTKGTVTVTQIGDSLRSARIQWDNGMVVDYEQPHFIMKHINETDDEQA